MKRILFSVVLVAIMAGEGTACVPWKDTIINNTYTTYNKAFSMTQQQNQSQTQKMSQSQSVKDSGNVNAPISNSLGNIGNPSIGFTVEAVPDFPQPYITVPAVPLTYQGPYDSSIFEDDQIWFNKPKWMKDMVENLPNGGKVTAAIYEKTKPVNFVQPREGTEFSKMKGYYLGNIYCKSNGPDDNPGTVWGGCARKLLEHGCTYAYKIAGAITYGARSKATNQSGGASFAGIFGQIFGFNAGGGASNTDHDASGYEIINLTWACVQ